MLEFGNQRLVGSLDWSNTARSFDGVRATIHRGSYRLDIFGASVVNLRASQFDRSTAGNNIYGVYGGLDKLILKAVLQLYFFWRREANLLTETGTRGNLGFATAGFRWAGQLPHHFDYGTEIAKQTGSLGSDSISAWAGHWRLGYTVVAARFQPHLTLEYNFASGDDNPHDGKRGTFDQLYPTGHDKYGLTDQVGWRNIENLRGQIQWKLRAKWTLTNEYDAWWLADPHDALYKAGGAAIARSSTGTAGRYVGQELDLITTYTFSPQLQFGGGFGHLFPGTFLAHTTPGSSYNYPYAMATYHF